MAASTPFSPDPKRVSRSPDEPRFLTLTESEFVERFHPVTNHLDDSAGFDLGEGCVSLTFRFPGTLPSIWRVSRARGNFMRSATALIPAIPEAGSGVNRYSSHLIGTAHVRSAGEVPSDVGISADWPPALTSPRLTIVIRGHPIFPTMSDTQNDDLVLNSHIINHQMGLVRMHADRRRDFLS